MNLFPLQAETIFSSDSQLLPCIMCAAVTDLLKGTPQNVFCLFCGKAVPLWKSQTGCNDQSPAAWIWWWAQRNTGHSHPILQLSPGHALPWSITRVCGNEKWCMSPLYNYVYLISFLYLLFHSPTSHHIPCKALWAFKNWCCRNDCCYY